VEALDGEAFEVRRGERVYRAATREALVRWARERRISADDHVRPAGSPEWTRAGDFTELVQILDPANWWVVRMGDASYTAPDFDTIVRWTREGRLTTDAVIEGPRTPPGGVLAQGLPRIAPFLRPPSAGSGAPRLRIDGVEYFPSDTDMIRLWITQSRVPVDAGISTPDGRWETISESGLFEPELWPAGAWGDETPDEEPPGSQPEASWPLFQQQQDPRVPPEVDSAAAVPASAGLPGAHTGEGWLIVTLNEEIPIDDPSRISRLLKNRRIHTFDDVVHPSLPEGRCSVARTIELLGIRRRRFPWWIVVLLALMALGVAFVLVDPLGLDIQLPLFR
jgi:hypothetical protein